MAGSLRFGLLGPLDACADGRRCAPTAPRLRTLLAVLLVRAGSVVPVTELVEELWGTNPPPAAANTLQVFVGRLRRQLAPRCAARDPGQVLLTAPGGYSLRVSPQQLDTYRFEQLARDGARHLADGESARAAETLRTALALWRGPALADVPAGEVLRAHAVSLTEARLAALEQRIESDLRLARHRELIGELRSLADRYPLREAFWRQLMLALYRCDRQAEALDAYHRLRRSLVDELGLDPGQQARELHRAILTRDPALAHAEPVSTAERTTTPLSRLPPDIADFTGRADTLDAVRDALRVGAPPAQPGNQAAPIVIMSGRGGAGKTTLAVHAAHLFAAAFPDGQLYASLRGATGGPTAPGDVLARFLRALGFDGAAIGQTVEDRADLYRARLADQRILVVLDDAAGETQVRPLLPASAGCAVLVTSRSRLPGLEGAITVELPLFAQAEAMDLLRSVVGADRVCAEVSAAERITRLCGRLPLAVRVAGAKLAAKPHWTVADMAGLLADERRRLNELSTGDLDVRASIGLSYRACAPADQRAFRLLGLLTAPDFPAWVAGALADLDLATAESTVERLVDAQLVRAAGRDQAGQLRYQLHDLIRVYAAERLREQEPAAECEGALDRLIGAYLDLARHADSALQLGRLSAARSVPGGTWPVDPELAAHVSTQPLAWYAAERVNLLAAVAQAHAGGRWEITCALVDNLAGFFDLRTRWDDWECVVALALDAARQAGGPTDEAVALRVRGQLRWDRGDIEDAIESLRRGVEVLAGTGAVLDRAHTLCELAAVYLDAGRGGEASACLAECVPVFEAHDDRRGLAFALRSEGVNHRELGRPEQAVDCFDRSLAYYRELGDRRWEAYLLLSRGGALWRCRRFAEAADSITACLPILTSLADRRWRAFALRQLGDVRRDQGRPAEARTCYAYALRILDELGDRISRADTLRVLGELCCDQGALAEAKQRLGDSLAVFTELDYRRGKPLALLALCRVALAEGRHGEGVELAERALVSFREMGLSLWQARALTELGRALHGTGDGRRARGCWSEALSLFRDLDEPGADQVTALLGRTRP